MLFLHCPLFILNMIICIYHVYIPIVGYYIAHGSLSVNICSMALLKATDQVKCGGNNIHQDSWIFLFQCKEQWAMRKRKIERERKMRERKIKYTSTFCFQSSILSVFSFLFCFLFWNKELKLHDPQTLLQLILWIAALKCPPFIKQYSISHRTQDNKYLWHTKKIPQHTYF